MPIKEAMVMGGMKVASNGKSASLGDGPKATRDYTGNLILGM